MLSFITPHWPAPATIKAYTTTRQGGVSVAPYHSFNLAAHVDDTLAHVEQNRQRLQTVLGLEQTPVWLNQTHSSTIVSADNPPENPSADASFSLQTNIACVILTADCLPILVCDRAGTRVAAIHAGWRGLLGGVIENTLNALNIASQELLVWLGPAMGPSVYEVGLDVYQAFTQADPKSAQAFVPNDQGRWYANLYLLAKQRLAKLGVTHIYGGNYCTYSDPERFFSFRRDQGKTGRMASLIWRE